jgi:A/G-specific adenine glycosylase
LRGVGPYTGAAVASIAFRLPHACVDGNVIRVISRLAAIDDDVRATPVKKRVASIADELLTRERPGDHNQAMMELGATICSPRQPACMACPTNEFCATFQRRENPHARPFKSKPKPPRRIAFRSLFLHSGGAFLLARRKQGGLLGSMWELPNQADADYRDWASWFHGPLSLLGQAPETITHAFTHLRASYRIDVAHSEEHIDFERLPRAYAEARWVRQSDLERLPLAKSLNKMLPVIAGFLEDGPCPTST